MYEVDGNKLRDIRIAKFLSQRQLAEKAGVTHSTINRLELGKQTAQGQTIRFLAAALDIDPGEIVVSSQKE